MQSLDQGAANIAHQITGAGSLKREEAKDAYFTNNEGIPWPDPAHSKNVGGLPLVSDTFLLQKQQTFNRSKNLESESEQVKELEMSADGSLQEWCIQLALEHSGILRSLRTSRA